VPLSSFGICRLRKVDFWEFKIWEFQSEPTDLHGAPPSTAEGVVCYMY
jgi:hypothetical protein